MQVTALGFLLLPVLHVLASASDVTDHVAEEEDDASPYIPPFLPDIDLDVDLTVGNGKEPLNPDRHDTDASKVCSMGIKCGRDSGVSVELPIQGITGAAGPPGETGLPGPPGVPGPPGESWDCNVAFYVGLAASHDFSYLTSDAPLVFDKVVTNRGDAYEVSTGQFKAPYDGIYIFYVTVSAKVEQKGAVNVLVNGTFLSTVWAESLNDWGSASNTYILDLVAGDQVGLLLQKRAHNLYAGMYTSFSGMCLWRNPPEV